VIHAVQCLNAGKHVLIEKPMALTKSGADEIEAARKKSGKVAFVGYQRRFAGAFLRTKELVEALPKDSINYGGCYGVRARRWLTGVSSRSGYHRLGKRNPMFRR
jgi:predicted dehydrogenase